MRDHARSVKEAGQGQSRRLTPEAQGLLDEPDDVRIAYLGRDCFIPYSKTDEISLVLERELERPRVQRQPGVLIFGEPNNGKSAVVSQFISGHPRIERPDEETDVHEVLSMEIFSAREIDFYDTAIKKLLSPFQLRTESDKRRHLFALLEQLQTRMIIIDEFHKMLLGSFTQRQKLWSAVTHLANEFKITIVIVGTHKAERALLNDKQLETRFRHRLELKPWHDDMEWQRFLLMYEAAAPLRKESRIWADADMRRFIVDHSSGLLGSAVELMQESAIEAIRKGTERITIEILRDVAKRFWIKPRMA